MPQGYPGVLVTFEGGEGGGKTTQIAALHDAFKAEGKEVVTLREPGGTVISEQIREVVLSSKNTGIAFTTEILLFQAARAQIYDEVVIPALKAGKTVLMDRSRDSSVVYQGIVRGFGKDLIEEFNKVSTQGIYPDMTILLDVSVEIGLQRRAQTGEVNRLDSESRDFHEKVRQAYLQLAKENSQGRWRIVNADKSFAEVDAELKTLLATVVK